MVTSYGGLIEFNFRSWRLRVKLQLILDTLIKYAKLCYIFPIAETQFDLPEIFKNFPNIEILVEILFFEENFVLERTIRKHLNVFWTEILIRENSYFKRRVFAVIFRKSQNFAFSNWCLELKDTTALNGILISAVSSAVLIFYWSVMASWLSSKL